MVRPDITTEEAEIIAVDAVLFALCQNHRLAHGLPFPGGTCDTRCPHEHNFEEIDCSDGCAVMDTCWVVHHRVPTVTFSRRKLAEWEERLSDELALARREYKAGVFDPSNYYRLGKGMFDDLERLLG